MELEQFIDARMRLLIAAKIPDRMRYIELEATTGISGDTWKNFWFKRRKADGAMVEKLARAHPEYAFWLATGATDVINGHQSPPNADCYEPNSVPLQTASTVLKKAVAVAKTIEDRYANNPENADEIAKVLHGFLAGDWFHDTTRIPLVADGMFKAIKAFQLAIKLREEERKLNA